MNTDCKYVTNIQIVQPHVEKHIVLCDVILMRLDMCYNWMAGALAINVAEKGVFLVVYMADLLPVYDAPVSSNNDNVTSDMQCTSWL